MVENNNNNNLKRNSEINKRVPTIHIDLGDGTHLRIAPSMVIERTDWKFELDGENLTYHATPELWIQRTHPNGVTGLWRKGEDLKQQ